MKYSGGPGLMSALFFGSRGRLKRRKKSQVVRTVVLAAVIRMSGLGIWMQNLSMLEIFSNQKCAMEAGYGEVQWSPLS